ncbi:sensor histidine kinase [Kribbella sp. CA-247076]|uniref:sensor histidine kinase n=1 Tax=Kribbella sp. CA-247076 TaxID=3239941 RepID=UPI003D90B4E9
MRRVARRWLGPVGVAVGLASALATALLRPIAGGPDAAALIEPVVLLVLAFAVARWAERLVVGAPIVVVALAVMVLRYSEAPELDAGGKALAVALWGAAGAAAGLLGWGLRALERARAAGREAEAYRRRLAVAAELHDFVAHDLSEVVARVQAARYVGGGSKDLERIEQAGIRSLESLEATVRALRVDGLPDGSGRELAALPGLVERFNATPGPRAELIGQTEAIGLSPEASALVYRTATECLTNVRKHAPDAGEVRIAIRLGDDVLLTVINDVPDRVAAPDAKRLPRDVIREADPDDGGSGLRMLRERARHVGGSLRFGTGDAGEWRVELVVPR